MLPYMFPCLELWRVMYDFHLSLSAFFLRHFRTPLLNWMANFLLGSLSIRLIIWLMRKEAPRKIWLKFYFGYKHLKHLLTSAVYYKYIYIYISIYIYIHTYIHIYWYINWRKDSIIPLQRRWSITAKNMVGQHD